MIHSFICFLLVLSIDNRCADATRVLQRLRHDGCYLCELKDDGTITTMKITQSMLQEKRIFRRTMHSRRNIFWCNVRRKRTVVDSSSHAQLPPLFAQGYPFYMSKRYPVQVHKSYRPYDGRSLDISSGRNEMGLSLKSSRSDCNDHDSLKPMVKRKRELLPPSLYKFEILKPKKKQGWDWRNELLIHQRQCQAIYSMIIQIW